MSIQHHNTDYAGGFPTAIGDRYHAQDLFRDFWYGIAQTGEAISRITSGQNARLRGNNIVQGATVNEIDIPEQYCLARYQVTVPDNIATLPGTTQTQSIFVPFTIDQTLAVSLATATLDGSTVNYVKASYSEVDDPVRMRNRAELAGSYSYEKIPTGVVTIDDKAPTDFEVSLATFVGDGSTTLTITQQPVYNIPQTVDGTLQTPNINVAGNVTASGQIDTVNLNVTGNLNGTSITTEPISRFYTGSDANNLDYPIGSTQIAVATVGPAIIDRNTVVGVAISTPGATHTFIIDVPPGTPGATLLIGTWVVRGATQPVAGVNSYLVQRVA